MEKREQEKEQEQEDEEQQKQQQQHEERQQQHPVCLRGSLAVRMDGCTSSQYANMAHPGCQPEQEQER